MFTNNTPNAGRHRATPRNESQPVSHGTVPIKRTALKIGALTATVALSAGLTLAAPIAASAATRPTAYAQGQILSGSLLGVNLDRIAALGPASASNNGTQTTQVQRDPLKANVLDNTLVNAPNGVQLSVGDIADIGALQQYAAAAKDGSSMAASGAISNDGGIGVGAVGTGAGGNLTVDLDSLLGNRYAGILTDLKLQATAIAAQAKAKMSVATGDYSLAGLKLNLTSPALANLSKRVANALAPVKSDLASMGGKTGDLADSVNGVVKRVNPLLNVLGTNATVNAKVTADLDGALAPLLTGTYGNGAISINLDNGQVSVDLAKLLGGKINDKAPGTEVLSDKVVNEILDGITSTVSTLGDQIVDRTKTALDNAKVDVDATVNVATPQAGILGKTCVNGGAAAGAGVTNDGGVLGGLLGGSGGLLGTGIGAGTGTGAGGVLNGILCTPTKTLLPDLKTSLGVHVHGTVGGIVDDKPLQAVATLKLLGLPANVNVNAIVDNMGKSLTDGLLDGDSATSDITNSVNSNIVHPAVTALLGTTGATTGTIGTGGIGDVLTHVLSAKLNVQDSPKTNDGVFTETALQIKALDTGSTPAATVNLASASVGPNVTKVVDPGDPGAPGDPGTGGGTTGGTGTTGGNTGGTGTITGAASAVTPFGNLAFTGMNIIPFVSALLALLIVGGYLTVHAYRRHHPRHLL